MSSSVALQTPNNMLLPREVAIRLGVTRQTVLNWFANGDLRGTRLSSRVIRFSLEDVEAFISNGRATKPRPVPQA